MFRELALLEGRATAVHPQPKRVGNFLAHAAIDPSPVKARFWVAGLAWKCVGGST